MADAALIDKAVKLAGTSPDRPSVQQAAADTPIPDNAWEYQIRKANNDAAFQNLDYKPYCGCMPICKEGCNNPHFMVRAPGACLHGVALWSPTLRLGPVQASV
jgi:hypothetical protein